MAWRKSLTFSFVFVADHLGAFMQQATEGVGGFGQGDSQVCRLPSTIGETILGHGNP